MHAQLFMKVHCGVHLSIRELTAFLRTRLSFSSVFSLKLRIGKVSKLLSLQTVNAWVSYIGRDGGKF